VQLRWCFDIPGEAGVPAADLTLDVALKHRPDGLVSFGLGGPELGVGRQQFAPHFEQARAAGLRSVPHAGESTGPETIWDAIHYLGAERIGHGIAAARDPRLMQHLRDHAIALEICPTSNVSTRSVPSLAEHPLPALVAAGVTVTINSDDPPMFATTLNHEYAVAADLLGLDAPGVADLARTAVASSFLDDAGKAALIKEIDAYSAGH
jgi:adenosine deaminase/aminodeoxyfutalosine deaminase